MFISKKKLEALLDRARDEGRQVQWQEQEKRDAIKHIHERIDEAHTRISNLEQEFFKYINKNKKNGTPISKM